MLPLNTVSLDGKLDQSLLPKLDRIKAEANVSGVMVDVWWGIVEKQQGQYNFNAYKELAQYCQRIGLKLQCVMSFHQCGGNVGDTCDIKLPSWLTQKDIFYRDMHGKDDPEYIALSMDDKKVNGRTPVDMYSQYMQAFKQQMGDLMGSTINEIQVGLGPCGELRYPAYTNNRGINIQLYKYQQYMN
ncbi:MAG: Beta-amylase [Streblomastix strix]|uniref:Beta-amylase n=1 Tax=Streblomastix strix TaxID=222440 RepID=A0A5J4U230_9EUKA|nr:MAG: Beta-amylase [Streblomastix strix]